MLRKILLQNLHLFGKRIGTLLIVASLDRTIKGFLRLLDGALQHGVNVGISNLATLVYLDILNLAQNLAKDGQADLVLCLHSGFDLITQFLVVHKFLLC